MGVLSATHQKFADGIAMGLNTTQAYRAAFPRCKSDGSAAVSGSRLLRNPKIEAEITRIRREAEKLAGGAVLETAEKRRFLARLVRARLSSEPDDSDLWQEISDTEHGRKRKLGDKLKAIQIDNDLAGEGAEAALAITITKAWAQ